MPLAAYGRLLRRFNTAFIADFRDAKAVLICATSPTSRLLPEITRVFFTHARFHYFAADRALDRRRRFAIHIELLIAEMPLSDAIGLSSGF